MTQGPQPQPQHGRPEGQVKQADERPKTSAGGKVIVACKQPSGIVIRPFIWSKQQVPVMGGGTREERIAVPSGAPVFIAGVATKHNEAPRARLVGGYALTEGVDAEIWAQWLEVNRNSALVKNGIVFAFEKLDAAEGWCREHKATRSGLEPLEKDGDARAPRAPNPNTSALAEEEERAKKVA